MEEKLDFSLPEKKQKTAAATKALIGLVVVLAVLVLVNLSVTLRCNKQATPETTGQQLSADQTKELAGKLAQRNLYGEAAKVWQDYLRIGNLTPQEQAKTLFQIGTLLGKVGRCEEAIECFYRSEMAAKVDELASQINLHIKDCFDRLGKFSALRYELMDRTSFKKSDQAGSKVVAEIGAEKITEADLDAVIESNIDNQLSAVSAFMTDEQLKEQKKKVLEQYKSPSVRQQFLQQWVAQEVLYRQAQQEQLAEKPEVKKLMEELCRGVLSQYMMNQQLAAKIKLTETDLQAYYTANKDKFIEPAKAKISHILVNDEKQAADLISRARGGEKFDGLAKEFSKDKDTKEAGGRIEGDVTKGDSYVPVVGDVNGLSEKIFAADANSVLDKPIKAEKGWEIVKVDEKTAERQKDFDEVRQQVMSMLLSQKRQDVRQDYIKQLMEQYNVVIHTSVFSDKKEDKTEDKAAGAVK